MGSEARMEGVEPGTAGFHRQWGCWSNRGPHGEREQGRPGLARAWWGQLQARSSARAPDETACAHLCSEGTHVTSECSRETHGDRQTHVYRDKCVCSDRHTHARRHVSAQAGTEMSRGRATGLAGTWWWQTHCRQESRPLALGIGKSGF